MRTTRIAQAAATWVISLLALSACKHSSPNFIYMPDMVYTTAVKAQTGQMRMPVAGTIDRQQDVYHFLTPEEAGAHLKNPLPRTKEVLLRGQAMFNTYCIVCHGANGEGDGFVVPKIPRPPSLQSDKIMKYPDGSIYHIIMAGQNIMPSYASQIATNDRWAIIHYLRALQRAKHPTPEDVKAFEASQGQ
jgi:cytochrome c553